MRSKVRAKRKDVSAVRSQPTGSAMLQARPFGSEDGSDNPFIAPSPTQAQVDRVARSPNLAAMPLYPTATAMMASSTPGAGVLQAKADPEANLKSPQGTLQRSAEDQQEQEEQLNLQPMAATEMSDDEEVVQQQADPSQTEEEKPLQAQLEAKQEETVRREADVEAEAEKDEAVQAQLEDEQEQTLQRQVEAEESKEELVQTELDLATQKEEKKPVTA